jgi:serine/threonine protein kinase
LAKGEVWLLIGKTILHYNIIEKLGEGGMGVVYLAEDTKLERKVAIKFLPRHIAADSEQRERFKIEARAAASLNHPNIATIHYIEEVEDETFIVMEYIDGFELRKKIKTGPMPLDEALQIIIKIAEGLQAAHEQDIVHRDIKSGNIMLTDKGRVKVMDFGLAKVRGVANVTKEGTTLGTITYMSPEQAGGSDVDNRSDIWSLGVLLYEMISGKLPFGGSYDQAVIYSIINDEPQPLSHHSIELQQIIKKALAKNPQERYQHVDQLLVDLRNIDAGQESGVISPVQKTQQGSAFTRWMLYGPGSILIIALFIFFGLPFLSERNTRLANSKSIAVMPFKNLSDDAANDYFSEGITEDIIAQLSNIKELKVIARSSVERFRDSGLASSEIGAKLHVASILEGSVRRGGDRVRIVSRLIDVKSEENIWAETYDRELKDIFEIQSDVSQRIAGALQAKLSPTEVEELSTKPTENLDAYNLYLRGRFHWRKRTVESLVEAATDFEQAVTLDNRFALAYVGLADCYALYPYYAAGDFSTEEAFNKAEQMARAALELEPDLAAAHTSLGNVLKEGIWDWAGAEREFKRALELNPKDANAYHWYSELLLILGRKEEALKLAEKAHELEPYSAIVSNNLGRTLLFIGNYEKATQQLKTTIEMDPTLLAGYANLGWVYLLSNQIDQFAENVKKTGSITQIEDLLIKLLREPSNKQLKLHMDSLLEQGDQIGRWTNGAQAPLVFALLGYNNDAIRLLNQLHQERSPAFIYQLGHPALDHLKDEPAFVKLYNKIGLKRGNE